MPPWPALVRELDARGVQVSEARARDAMLAEMAYYRANHDDASDWSGLADLRLRCAGIIRGELRIALPVGDVQEAMLAAIRFRPYPEVPGVLRELRRRGEAIVVVSNWDVSLHEVLARTGLAALVDGAVTSAELGVAKPDPAIFAAALVLAGGVAPADALHAGDSLDADVAGARAAGLHAVLVRRERDAAAVDPSVRVIASLDGLLDS